VKKGFISFAMALLSVLIPAAEIAAGYPVIPEAGEHFEIYSIEGTAGSVTGQRWVNMLAWREQARVLAQRYRDIVFVNMDPADNAVYLTFDDGPDTANTVKVMSILKEYGVTATFFFTGSNIERHPAVVKQAHDAGFAIGLHSCSHARMTELTEDEILSELNRNNDLLETATGARSGIMRPPFGALGDREIEIIDNSGLRIYLWSIDTLDWAQSDPSEILRNIKDYIRPGDIILMHSGPGQSKSAEILPSVIEFIRDAGYEMRALPVTAPPSSCYQN